MTGTVGGDECSVVEISWSQLEAREGYQKQLDSLREDVLQLSEMVLNRVRTGLEALAHRDEWLAQEVIDGVDEINQLYLDLEQDCIDLLAPQQLVSGDLRFVAASFKIITDLERIADLARNLGEYTLRTRRHAFQHVDVQAIGDIVVDRVQSAIGAYEREDPDTCFALAKCDDEVDRACEMALEAVVRDLIGREADAGTGGEATERLMDDISRILLTLRDLERVGDHAVNIAARTLYMVDNDDSLVL